MRFRLAGLLILMGLVLALFGFGWRWVAAAEELGSPGATQGSMEAPSPPVRSAHGLQMEELGWGGESAAPEFGALESAAATATASFSASPALQSATPAIANDSIVFGYIQSQTQLAGTRWHALTHLGALFTDFNSSGGFNNLSTWTGRSSFLRAGGAAQAAGVKVVMVVRNEGFDEATLATVMQSPTLRQTLATNVKNAVTADSYCAGVSFDFEFSWTTATRDGITAFLQYLRGILPAQYEISVYTHAIYHDYLWDVSAIAPLIDYMLYSTYDWATGNTAHAISDFNNDLPYIADYLTAGLPPNKMVIVWAAYSRRWTGITTYNATGSGRSSQGFTDGLYDTTLNPNYGGPYGNNYVTGDEVGWYTWNNGTTDYTVTWDSPESLEYKLRSSLIFPGDAGAWAGARLRGVGFWSLMWMAESTSYNGNASDPPTGNITGSTTAKGVRTYPHVYELCETIFSPPGTTRHLFEGFEGLDPEWRSPNLTPDTSAGTFAYAVVAAPAGTGRPPNTTNAARVTFSFGGASSNRAFFRHELLASQAAASTIDSNGAVAYFDATTKLGAYVYTPAAYANCQARMVVMDGIAQTEMSDPYSLNASGWRRIEWDLTDAAQIHAYNTSEWALLDGNGILNTAGGGKPDIGFIGFVIEGTGTISGAQVYFDELTYEHANPGGRNYVINEFRYAGTGATPATSGEYVEVYGPAGAVPAGLQVRVFAGATGNATAHALGGATIPDDGGGFGYLVVGDPGVPGVDVTTGFSTGADDLFDANPTGVQLYDTATGCVYDSVTYEAFGGLAQLVRQQTLGVTQNGYPWIGEAATGTDASGIAYAMGRYPDGWDTHRNNADFSVMPASPGGANGGSVALSVTYDFAAAPAGAFQAFQTFGVANPTAAGLPASPDGGNAYRCVDPAGGGVIGFIGDGALGAGDAGYVVAGQIYIPSGSAPANAIAVGLCGRQGSNFFTASPAASGYESGYWLIYENAAGVGLSDGRADHPGVFEFVHATNDNMDQQPVALLGSATLAATGAVAGQWAAFELTIEPGAAAGEQLVAKMNGATVYSGAIPAGGPTSGAFQVGFRENHAGGPAAAEGTWIDGVTMRLPGPPPTLYEGWMLY